MLKKLGTIYLLLLFFFFPSHQILQNNPVNDVVIIYDWLKKTTTTSPAIVLAILECHQALIFGNPSKEIIKSKPLIAPTPQKKFFKNHVFCYIVLTLVCVCVCVYMRIMSSCGAVELQTDRPFVFQRFALLGTIESRNLNP